MIKNTDMYSLSMLILLFTGLLHTSQSYCNFSLNGSEDRIKGMFVFGSSLVDNGNNNFLQNIAKADYLPYGIDFHLGPSGRFTNGKNVIDLLGDELRLPGLIPPYADPSTKGHVILNGVNYASGGSGILDDTGSLAGKVMSLNQQIEMFEMETLPDLESQMGCKSTDSLRSYLFIIGSGSNDYTFNYFASTSNSNRNNVTLQAFTANLTASLSCQLKRLYKLGGRKFVLMAINPIGCSPMVKASRPAHAGCIQDLNQAAHLFNVNLKSLVDNLPKELPGSIFVFVNSYKIIRDIMESPISRGFKDIGTPCCDVPSLEEGGNGILCKRLGDTCTNRSEYVFFDGLHPTEAVNVQIANRAFNSNLQTEVYPFNMKKLVEL